MTALAVTVIAGAVILAAVDASIATSSSSVDQTIAAGMAAQMVDEVLGARYVAAGGDPYQWPFSPNAWEQGGTGRERYNDTDDYHGVRNEGPEDIWGYPLGTDDGAGGQRHPNFRVSDGHFDRWRREAVMYYVDEDNPSVNLASGRTSNLRALEVRIYKRTDDGRLRPLAEVRRVFAYFPQPE